MYGRHPFLGMLFIVVGSFGLLYAMGELLIRIIAGIFALIVINHGMRLSGIPSMQKLGNAIFFRRWF